MCTLSIAFSSELMQGHVFDACTQLAVAVCHVPHYSLFGKMRTRSHVYTEEMLLNLILSVCIGLALLILPVALACRTLAMIAAMAMWIDGLATSMFAMLAHLILSVWACVLVYV